MLQLRRLRLCGTVLQKCFINLPNHDTACNMPRKARIDAPGALHHIICRGIERRKIFRNNTDKDDFLNRLPQVLSETNTPCYAWALLSNHLHLLLRTGNAPMATIMRKFLTVYVVRNMLMIES